MIESIGLHLKKLNTGLCGHGHMFSSDVAAQVDNRFDPFKLWLGRLLAIEDPQFMVRTNCLGKVSSPIHVNALNRMRHIQDF